MAVHRLVRKIWNKHWDAKWTPIMQRLLKEFDKNDFKSTRDLVMKEEYIAQNLYTEGEEG